MTTVDRSQKYGRWAAMSTLHRSIVMAYAFAVVLFVAGEVISVGFDSPAHILTILVISSFVGYVGIGQTLVILTGGIDLSIAYLMNATAVFMTGLVASHIQHQQHQQHQPTQQSRTIRTQSPSNASRGVNHTQPLCYHGKKLQRLDLLLAYQPQSPRIRLPRTLLTRDEQDAQLQRFRWSKAI